MKSVVVGVDGSAASRHALRWAGDVASRAGMELTAARVIQPGHAEATDAVDRRRAAAERELAEWCASLPARCKQREVVVVVDHDVPRALLDVARSGDAGLLVVANHGAKHLHLGDVVRYLAHHAPLPLAVVPPGAPVTTNRLVVGRHRRTGNAAALALAANLARGLNVPVTAVYSHEQGLGERVDVDVDEWKRRAQTEVRAWAAPVEAAGVRLDVYVDADRDVDCVAAILYALDQCSGSAAVIGVEDDPGRRAIVGAPLQLVRQDHHAVILVPASTSL